ncbi:MAG TPA: DinB family protein [Acidimicrobiia bacterium]
MDVASLLLELYGRIPPLAHDAVDDVDLATLAASPSPGANTIAWLVWHSARVQDHHVAQLIDSDQIWIGDDWARDFGLDPDPSNTGYGHTSQEVASVRPVHTEVLIEYLEAVNRRTYTLLEGLTPNALDRIVDRRWDPPVTLGVRLVSIADDSLQHLGQAAYLRGLLAN